MTLTDLEEALSLIDTMLTSVATLLSTATGVPAANLKYAIDDLRLNADTLVRTHALGPALANIFVLAVTAGVTAPGLDVVRETLASTTPKGDAALWIANTAIQMVLGCEVQVYSATTFSSNQDVVAAIAQLDCAFEPAIEFAADNGDHDSYALLVAARGGAVNDLRTRGRQLPKLVPYSFGKVMTSHALSQRLYGTATRANELVEENKIINPAFCTLTGVALSS